MRQVLEIATAAKRRGLAMTSACLGKRRRLRPEQFQVRILGGVPDLLHTKHRVPKRVGMTCGSFSGSGSACRACAPKLRKRSYGVCRTSGGYSTVGEIAQSGRAPISDIGCRGFDSRSYTSQSRWQLEDVKAVPGNHPGAGSKGCAYRSNRAGTAPRFACANTQRGHERDVRTVCQPQALPEREAGWSMRAAFRTTRERCPRPVLVRRRSVGWFPPFLREALKIWKSLLPPGEGEGLPPRKRGMRG